MAEMDVQVVTLGTGVSPSARAYARMKVRHLGRYAPRRVLFARVTLERLPDPAAARPAHADATLDVNGRPLCARADAAEVEAAVDLLEDRLRRRLTRLAGRRQARRRHRAGDWARSTGGGR